MKLLSKYLFIVFLLNSNLIYAQTKDENDLSIE